ncbi:MAG: asparagine synthase (glutamine-hydrolyzing) [Rickettsiales bacterium]|nr:asparagine synthase (glutamine-hydrolyzing) [Rickettsiales bacterium]
MCGIVGSINIKWSEDPLLSIINRGPDYQDFINIKNVFLGHTRLSIQDLSSLGNQPMQSSDGRFTLVYNGEIYNHWQIRENLIKKGYTFNSTSDTETLMYSWVEWGQDAINYFNGIFAFAIHDMKENKLFIVRDHFGVKPLYIYSKGGEIAFSSEIKAFINIKDFDATLNFESIVNYLTFLWSPGPRTMYKYVNKLIPGQIIEIDTKTLATKQNRVPPSKLFNGEYWDLSESEWIKKIDDKLNVAVEKQLLSDAPLGYFLSGGLDSSLLVAIAKTQRPNNKLECFTIDQFKDSSGDGFIDDLPYAKKVAKYLDVSLNIIDGRDDWVNLFDKMIWQLDEPQADLAPINVSIISSFAKNMGIKVLIGGAGGDDVFSGYRRHQALLLNSKLDYFPSYLFKMLSSLIQDIPFSNTKIRRLKKFSRDWGADDFDQLLGYFNWLPSNHFVFEMFSNKSLSKILDYNPYSYGKKILSECSVMSKLDQLLVLEQKTFLIDHNLNYTDKLSMVEGVEARVPYLDFDLVKLAGHIPQSMKMKNNIPKYILKKVAEKYLPKDVINRSKTGFGAPVKELMKNEFTNLISKDLSKENIEKDGIYNYPVIEKMITDNDRGKADYSYNILSLLSIQSWLKQFPWTI